MKLDAPQAFLEESGREGSFKKLGVKGGRFNDLSGQRFGRWSPHHLGSAGCGPKLSVDYVGARVSPTDSAVSYCAENVEWPTAREKRGIG